LHISQNTQKPVFPVIALKLTLVVLSLACSADSDSRVEPVPATHTELLGMYEWDPQGSFPNATWSGKLAIDGPCAYLDVYHQDGVPVPESRPLRSLIRLSEPLTRLDPSTGEVWIGEYGPMSSGDKVILVGSEGWQQDWNQPGEDTSTLAKLHDPANIFEEEISCSTNVSFYAASMRLRSENSEDTQSSINLDSTHVIAGLFPWDAQQGVNDIGDFGILKVEPPCIYVQKANEGRRFLKLPRPLVRFDSVSNSIWVGSNGPMTSGDIVSFHDGGGDYHGSDQIYEGDCIAHGKQHAVWMTVDDSEWWDPDTWAYVLSNREPGGLGDPKELFGELFAMSAATGRERHYSQQDEGILLIEYPCVYFYPRKHTELLYASEDRVSQEVLSPDMLQGERFLLSLVRDWTDYDPKTNTLSFREYDFVPETNSYTVENQGSGEGLIASGDRVNVVGILNVDLGYHDLCERDSDIAVRDIFLCELHACRLERAAHREGS